MIIDGKRLLKEKEISSKIGISIHWLRNARYKRYNDIDLPYYKLTNKIYYNLEEVEKWLSEHMVRH